LVVALGFPFGVMGQSDLPRGRAGVIEGYFPGGRLVVRPCAHRLKMVN
tara:strand:- start:319 stop:462 length:144 start_codon:yes stop_codon:yes gene_type:complete